MDISKVAPENHTELIGEEERYKKTLTLFAVWLAITIIVGGILDYFFGGGPLGFTIPLLNMEATDSLFLYYAAVLTSAFYIGFVGIKELVIEKRFSVEFLMAVAGLGALYLDYRF